MAGKSLSLEQPMPEMAVELWVAETDMESAVSQHRELATPGVSTTETEDIGS
jgi:hypothetical protein